ncbi:rnapii degradation factor [Schizosaccharomyces cryophilus OY26]|uniref:RNA polymerase II degradation factor 1 n=1 Tax=Schizosaccharomyces cryophilus (strain OY26 / ATCC MYA-4695 / CBS 11777 / NBRC 106824 / NRRL Y48691) TaxID=653667 RepID=S9X9V2_SCHCR|nr:rnapii degradation factor [Schizosaccharomyces cryophilus OY26]EPY50541.1 rnapii degradation factor [Schizosaccharomyces cryophilus OY26]
MSENKKIRSKKAEEGLQNANKPAASEETVQVDSVPPRRSTRGKRGPKGKQGSSNAAKNSPESEETQAIKLNSDPRSQVSALKELFSEWTTDDLVFALEEAGHDLELTIAHITEGHASQWGQVKKKQPTKQLKPKSKPVDSDAAAPKTTQRKSKKAPTFKEDQPQPSRKEKATTQTKTSTTAPASESSKSKPVPGTDVTTSTAHPSKLDDAPQQHIDTSNANTIHATQTELPSTSATMTIPPQTDKPATVAAPSQSSKTPWAAIAKAKRKQASQAAAIKPSEPSQPAQLPSAPPTAAVEQPSNPPVPLASRPAEPAVPPQQDKQEVPQQKQQVSPTPPAVSSVNKPVVGSIPASTTTSAPSQTKTSDTKASLTGFHGSTNGITTARLLSDKFPVVMPVANTAAIPEKVQVRFGSLTLGGDDSLSNKPAAAPTAFTSKQVKEPSTEAYVSPKPQPPQFADSKPALASDTDSLPAKLQPQFEAQVSASELPHAPAADNYYFDVKSNPSATSAVGSGAPQVSLPAGNAPSVNKQGNGGFMAMYSPAMQDIAPQQYGAGTSLPMSAASAYTNDPSMAGVHDKSNLPYSSRFGKPLENRAEANVSPFDNFQHVEYGAAPGFGPNAAQQHQQSAHAAYSGMSPLNYGQSIPNYFNERSQYSQYDPAISGTPEMHSMSQNKVGTSAAIPSLPNTTATPSPVISQQPQPYAFPPMYPVPYMSYPYGSLPYGNNKYGQPQQGYVMQNGLNDFPPILGGHSNIYNRQQSGSVGSIGGTQVNATANAPVDKARDMSSNNAMGSSLGGFSSMAGASRSAPLTFANEGERGGPSPYGYVTQASLNASPGGHQGSYQSNANKAGNVGNQTSGFSFNPTTAGSGNGIGSYGAYNQTFMNRPGNWYGNA